MPVRIASLHCYPLKSARGLALERAQLTAAGIAHDRRWMVVTPEGRFQTQRELPRLALIAPQLTADALLLRAPGHPTLQLPLSNETDGRAPRGLTARAVTIWKDLCGGLDEGHGAARWLASLLGRDYRLVRFDAAQPRLSASQWTGSIRAETRFADGFPLLVIGQASLADLNTRLSRALPMNRFRPNIVLEGIAAYEEDHIDELYDEQLCLRLVKPCTRCVITTTDQESAERDGEEPLRTLRAYRYDAQLQGVAFGQNAVIVRGAQTRLRQGQRLQVRWKQASARASMPATPADTSPSPEHPLGH